MAGIQATAHAATWLNRGVCGCVCDAAHYTVWLYECPPCLHSFLSSTTFTLWALPSSSSAHILTPLACLLCVCGLCSVGLSADISISHMFITAATPTRCVPPLPLLFPCSLAPLATFPPSLRSLAAYFPLATMAGMWQCIVEACAFAGGCFCVHFPGALLIVRLPPPHLLLSALPTTNHLTSFLLPDNPPPLAAFAGGSGAGQGIGWGRTP